MVRTTPSRPVDIQSVFPVLASLARTATRLHPRPGNPSPQDSSVGGPLLWPASEPWPHCDGSHDLDGAMSLADARLEGQVLAAASGRYLTPQERETLKRIRRLSRGPETGSRPHGDPVAMLPVAQLYSRDVPDLRPPAGTDLLQVLWCPFDHQPSFPKTALFWRSADEVTGILALPPEPAAVQSRDYVPRPCTVDPEQVTEYPAPLELDNDLATQVEMWCVRHVTGIEPDIETYDREYEEEARFYFAELCTAPGWKVGGYVHWGFTDPYAPPCPACGAPTEPLLTIASREWDGEGHTWIPYEDQAAGISGSSPSYLSEPSGIDIRGGYKLIIRTCPASPGHPHVQHIQ